MTSPERSIASRTAVSSVLAGLFVAAALAPVGAAAADPAAGRAKAASCVVCHGQHGYSTLPNAPHLAGQPAVYLEEQLKNYRSGKRPHEVMNLIAKPLSDADIENLAAWYGSIPISVAPPR